MTNTDKQNMFIIRWLHNVKYDGKKSEYPYGHVIYIFIMDIKTDCIFFSFFFGFPETMKINQSIIINII